MDIIVSNEIFIKEPAKEIVDYCKKELAISNPEFIKKERMGLYTGNTPRQLQLYKVDGDTLIVPIGSLKDIIALIKYYHLEHTASTDLADNGTVDYSAKVALYDYQEQAVEALLKKGYGILQSKAGSGKTQMGIALIAKLGVKTLWLTHTQDLLSQSYDRAKQYMDESLLGTITAGKVNIGKGITFATVQTLSKQDLTQYKYTWDCVVVDEVHRCAGTPTAATQFSKVISNLACEHKYGLSATVHRADGLVKTTFMLVGNIAYTVPDEAIADKVMDVTVEKVEVPLENLDDECLDTDGTIIYTKVINSLCSNKDRNKVITKYLTKEKEHYNLILSDRLKHLEALMQSLPQELREQAVLISGKMTSKKGRQARAQAIEDMKTGKKHYLFASYKLAKEGLDIPRLDRLHLATPQKDYAVITQSIGRVARTFDGKKQPICYDYVDTFGMFENMYKLRCRSYRKCGCILCKS